MPSLRIAVIFLRIGAFAFGGLGPTLALIERELVDRRRVITRDDIAAALTHTKVLPGSTVVQVVAYLAWQLRGWSGATLATTAFLLPSAVVMALLAAAYAETPARPELGAIRAGVLAAVVALLVVTLERFGRPLLTGCPPIATAVAAFLAVLVVDVNAVWVVVAAGVVGVATGRWTS